MSKTIRMNVTAKEYIDLKRRIVEAQARALNPTSSPADEVEAFRKIFGNEVYERAKAFHSPIQIQVQFGVNSIPYLGRRGRITRFER